MFKKIIANILREFADKIECDACELSTEDALNVLSSIAHIKINKQEVAEILNCSTKTVERKEANGEIPPSHNCSCTKKNWYLDEINVYKSDCNLQNVNYSLKDWMKNNANYMSYSK